MRRSFLVRSRNEKQTANSSAMGIMYMVYLFLFSWFKPDEPVTQHRALAWQSIHLPLHLGILLLMAAMVVSSHHGLYNTF